MNSGESIPSVKPTAVATAATIDEWLLGMPPVLQKMFSRISLEERGLFLNSATQDLRIWALNQLQKAERKIGCDRKRVKGFIGDGPFPPACPHPAAAAFGSRSFGQRDTRESQGSSSEFCRRARICQGYGFSRARRAVRGAPTGALTASRDPNTITGNHMRIRNEATREWLYAGKSAATTYASFFYWLFREPFPSRQTLQQFMRVLLEGFGTLLLGAVIQGMMFAWLAGYYGRQYSFYSWSGALSNYALLSETTTLIGGMLFACRVGTAFTVEIGSMQMTGQLDALRLMAVEPIQHIVIPRVLSSIVALVILKAITDGVAILSAMFFLNFWFAVSFPVYLQHAFQVLRSPILTTSYIRIAIMAFFVSLNATGIGFHFIGGAEELGKSTTKSIVINFVTVLVVDWVYGMVDLLTGWSTV
jgi:phospholipid/cholesterol/gamma-HCH transport system permease protein